MAREISRPGTSPRSSVAQRRPMHPAATGAPQSRLAREIVKMQSLNSHFNRITRVWGGTALPDGLALRDALSGLRLWFFTWSHRR